MLRFESRKSRSSGNGGGGWTGGEVGVMQTLASSLLTEWKVVFPSVGPGEELDVINEDLFFLPEPDGVSRLFFY